MDVEQGAREMNMAMTVEDVAKLISGAPFPSKQSLAKARAVVEFLGNRAVLTPPEGDMGNPISFPEGFVLVPVEPTEAMLRAGGWVEPPDAHGQEYIEKQGAAQCWKLMMNARPEVKP